MCFVGLSSGYSCSIAGTVHVHCSECVYLWFVKFLEFLYLKPESCFNSTAVFPSATVYDVPTYSFGDE